MQHGLNRLLLNEKEIDLISKETLMTAYAGVYCDASCADDGDTLRKYGEYWINIKRNFAAKKRLDDILFEVANLKLKAKNDVENHDEMCYNSHQAFPTLSCLEGGCNDSI